jgi:folate-binding Fe-S cluster repair protein YgfZ
MLNLDIDEFGVNFSKGCYPGQEVVARLHYLGEAKRRLFLLNLILKYKLEIVFIVPPLSCKSTRRSL